MSKPSSGHLAPSRGAYAPRIDPAAFVAVIDNPYFPLRPGTAFHYRGVAENGRTPQTDDMVVTIVRGKPRPGDAYRQEYYPNHAEDQARVLGPGGSLAVPFGSYENTLLTEETSPRLDPGVAERKYDVAGVGDVKEQAVRGNHELIQLVGVTR